jgi:hypothetical protein
MASAATDSMARRDASSRVSANTSRPLRSASASRPVVAKGASASMHKLERQTGQQPPSNIASFLSNLALLDLDLLEDWPGIDIQTFSSSEGRHGSKQRIRCVEWALYHLFRLWDPMLAERVRFRFLPSAAFER